MADFQTLLIEDRGPARVITINRPKVLNALNADVVRELSRALEPLAQAIKPDGVRGVVLCGAGDKAFVAGADIASMASMVEDDAMVFASQGHAVGEMIAMLPIPVIAAVHGFALGGGCELALACDFIYAGPKAKFGQPEVKLGVIPGFGGTQRLLRRVGMARALELCLTGEMIRAPQALTMGLCNRIVEEGSVVDAAVATIETIATMGPLAIAAAKRVIHEGEASPLPAGNQLEVEAFSKLFSSLDQREGMAAFIEKRAAAFRGE